MKGELEGARVGKRGGQARQEAGGGGKRLGRQRRGPPRPRRQASHTGSQRCPPHSGTRGVSACKARRWVWHEPQREVPLQKAGARRLGRQRRGPPRKPRRQTSQSGMQRRPLRPQGLPWPPPPPPGGLTGTSERRHGIRMLSRLRCGCGDRRRPKRRWRRFCRGCRRQPFRGSRSARSSRSPPGY